MKKLISAFLAVIMVFLMCMPTFAVDISPRQSTDVECLDSGIFEKIESVLDSIWDFFNKIFNFIKEIINPTEENPKDDEGESDNGEEDSTSNFKVLYLEDGYGRAKEFKYEPGDIISETCKNYIPERYGFEFKGWEPEIPEVMPEHDVTCVAKWEQMDGYSTIYFSEEDEFYLSVPRNGITLKEGTEISEIKYTRMSYALEGFEPELPKTMPEEDMTVKAIWRKKTDVSVTWRTFDGEKWNDYIVYYDVGDRIEVLEDAIGGPKYYDKLGNPQYFAGWAPEPVEIATEDVIYTAQYMGY